MNKNEIRIFLTFFLVYSFFIYWASWNEESRFSLTKAIVNEGIFEIDSFYNQTGDRSYYNGHYYSDKEPGLSFLATPSFASLKFVYYNFFPKTFIEKNIGTDTYTAERYLSGEVVHYTNPGFFISVSRIFITILTSSSFAALSVILVFKISKYLTNNKKIQILLLLVAGLGSLIFHSGLVFVDYGTATFFSFLGFYILFEIKHKKINTNIYFVLSGLVIGYAISTSLMVVSIVLACTLYILHFDKRKISYFFIGLFFGVLPVLLYNYFSFGSPFTAAKVYLDSSFWSKLRKIEEKTPILNTVPFLQLFIVTSYYSRINPFIIIRLLFYPSRGLFFYYPVLLLSFIGLFYFYKKFKFESILIVLIFSLCLLINSLWTTWWGGPSFGPRYLTPAIPFLILPLASFFEKVDKIKIIKILSFFLIGLSIFYNFTGLQNNPDELIDIENRVKMKPSYQGKVNTFEVINNPLYDYYIPNFLKNGPRSRVFESLMSSSIDIKCTTPSCGLADIQNKTIELFYLPNIGSVSLKLPFLCLFPLFVAIILIWYSEIFCILGRRCSR